MLCLAFLQEFFEEAMRLLQSNHGYNASLMPDWVEAFIALCIHNVDPERTFNVVGAYRALNKRSPSR